MKLRLLRKSIKDAMFGKTTNKYMLNIQANEMADARLGVMYLLGNTTLTKAASLSNAHIFENLIVGLEPLADLKNAASKILEKTDAVNKISNSKLGDKARALSSATGNAANRFKQTQGGQKIVKVGEAVGGAAASVVAKIKQLISDFFSMMMNKIRNVYGELLHGVETFAEIGTWLTAEFSWNLSSLIDSWGYAQNAADTYSGIKQAIFKSKDLITQIYAGRGVNLLGGHPSIIANALARHSATGVLGGIKDTAIGITGIALQAGGDAFAGAGTLVALVKGIFDRIVKMVDYLIQKALLSKVLKRAKKEWTARETQGFLVKNHKQFSEWFQSAVISTPIVAALAMGSGFAAHPYKFAQLLTPKYDYISQGEYEKAVVYINKLKSLSGKYVQEYTDGYGVQFSSTDGLVDSRLRELQEGKGELDGYEFVTT